jgi:3-isopropylmalate/(R)-2-methylmalate dehydratase large subunit
MPQTITEKIFSNHSSKASSVGDYVIADLDLVMAHDTTCAWAIDPFLKIAKKVWDTNKIFIPFDHAYPCPSLSMAKLQSKIRKFAKEQGLEIITDGVCHQLLAERYIEPGQIILGADSHTPTGGALGAITVGVGSTDAAIAMATGKCWFKVPDTIKINISGKLQNGVYAKDIILKIAGDLGPEGGRYRAIEFGGDTVKKMDIPSRLTLTNMCAELGAKIAIVPPDQTTLDYITSNNRTTNIDIHELQSDEDCNYLRVLEYSTSELTPQVAKPHDIDNVSPAEELEAKKIDVDQVFIGSCTNCRIEDLEVVYNIWQSKKAHPDTRVIITPASKKVFGEALERGYIKFFMEFGASITTPGCGACLGRQGGILAAGEVCVSTSNRNFQGRMGSPDAFIYLASPATAAASAVTGQITDPRKFS